MYVCLYNYTCACVLSHFSVFKSLDSYGLWLHQAPLSMGFSRQEYWSELPRPPPGCLSHPGIEPTSPAALAFQADSLPLSNQRIPLIMNICFI